MPLLLLSDGDSPMGPAAPTRSPVAVVTGAGSGLGRALAVALATKGWRLVLVGRRRERLKETATGFPPATPYRWVAADVGEPETGRRVVDEALGAFGQLDTLVNNAGLARFGPVTEARPADVEAMVRTHLTGPLGIIGAAVPALRRSRGTIVNVGSIGGLLTLPRRAAYGASKAALHHLTRSLARELAPEVRVNTVAPGAIDTEMYDDLGLDEESVAALRTEMVSTTPLGRMGRPEEVVPWIELLLGPAGAWVTGSLIVVDGGRSC